MAKNTQTTTLLLLVVAGMSRSINANDHHDVTTAANLTWAGATTAWHWHRFMLISSLKTTKKQENEDSR